MQAKLSYHIIIIRNAANVLSVGGIVFLLIQ